MAVSTVNSGAQLKLLGLRLKAAGDGGLRRNLLTGIRQGANPLVGDVRAAARAELPHSGGLNEYVANSPIAVRTRLTGTVGVQIVNSHSPSRKGGITEFGTDRGHLRHPTFGRRGKGSWVTQTLPRSGWFSKTLEEKAPEVEGFVFAAMERTSAEICKL